MPLMCMGFNTDGQAFSDFKQYMNCYCPHVLCMSGKFIYSGSTMLLTVPACSRGLNNCFLQCCDTRMPCLRHDIPPYHIIQTQGRPTLCFMLMLNAKQDTKTTSYRARKSRRTLQNKVRIKVFPEQLALFVNTFVVFKNELFNNLLRNRPDYCSEIHACSYFSIKQYR